MKMLSVLAFLVVASAQSLVAQATPAQKSLLRAMKEYHRNIGTFEALAARASREGIPDCLTTGLRLHFYMTQGEMGPLKLLLSQVERAKDELLSQKIEPMTPAAYEQLVEGWRKVIALAEKDPTAVAASIENAAKRAQARSMHEDLLLLDSATDQFAIEFNKGPGFVVAVDDWKRYLNKDSRLGRTGANCFGQPYGPQTVDQSPTIPLDAFRRVASVIPEDFFHPFAVASK